MPRYDDAAANRVPPADAEDNQGTLVARFQRAPAKPPAMPPAEGVQTPPPMQVVPPPASVPQRPAIPVPPPVDAPEPTVLARAPFPSPAAPRPAGAPLPLAAGNAEAVCRRVRLSDEAAQLLDGRQTLLAYLYRLMKWQLHRDAVRVLAHALPERSGIWWAWECARLVAAPLSSAQVFAALEATGAWLADPSEDRRQACGKAAAEVGPGTPAGSAALAVFWTAGTPVHPRRPFAVALEHFPAQAVASAVVLAALEGDEAGTARRYLRFLGEGLAVATGMRAVL
jgi:hypothetical protein